MAFVRTIHPSAAEAELAEVYAKVAPHEGDIPNIFRVQSLNPPALDAHFVMYRTIMFGPSSLSRAERELVAVAVSAVNGCHY